MKSIIITGNQEARESYIREYIKENKVKTFNVVRFVDRVKISDARAIKKMVSVKQPEGEKRLFVLSSDITIEAQNALLKTLEELPEDIDIVLSVKNNGDLLSTIISRSYMVDTGRAKEVFKDLDEFEDMLIKLICQEDDKKKIISGCLLLSNKISSLGPDEFDKIFLCLRSLMLKISEKKISCNKTSLRLVYNLITLFTDLYPLIVNNNLNKKLTMDYIFLNSLFPDETRSKRSV